MRLARESLPFLAAAAIATGLASLWSPWASVVPLVALGFLAWFFRDPDRTPPADPHVLVCPADGRVLRSKEGRISIFMNVFDVHVCRTPAAGTVRSIVHETGRFLAAWRDEASEHNERATFLLDGLLGPVRFTLVAGLVARRIVPWVTAGERLCAGDRVGLICFGSRVDVDLPDGAEPAVRPGDRVRAGESVIARLPDGHTVAPVRDDKRPAFA